jgi:hypothetical protein
MDNIVKFPKAKPETEGCESWSGRRNKRAYHHDLSFRGKRTIIEAAEADLVRDVGTDIHKARVKLKRLQQRIEGLRLQSEAELELLREATAKLSAAIVAALLARV